MTATPPPDKPERRPFWQDVVLAIVASAIAPLAHHAGKAVREWLRHRRGELPAPKESP